MFNMITSNCSITILYQFVSIIHQIHQSNHLFVVVNLCRYKPLHTCNLVINRTVVFINQYFFKPNSQTICDILFPLLYKNCNAETSNYVQCIRNLLHSIIFISLLLLLTHAENADKPGKVMEFEIAFSRPVKAMENYKSGQSHGIVQEFHLCLQNLNKFCHFHDFRCAIFSLFHFTRQ